ncbi:MAG: heavy-metal-associated domain-containing protein [Chloroflexota bacterium]
MNAATMGMQTAHYLIPLLSEPRQAIDLSNTINAFKGVNTVHIDLATRHVSVTFDSDYTSAGALGDFICRTGYPIEE